jgi:hypothetical protein
MTNKISDYKPKFAKLEAELKLLRSFLIGMAGKDKEGNYRPEFVEKALKAAQEKEQFTFKNATDFLTLLKK